MLYSFLFSISGDRKLCETLEDVGNSGSFPEDLGKCVCVCVRERERDV